MARKLTKKAGFLRRAKNQRAAASHETGARKEARLMIVHGYEKLARTAHGGKRKKGRKR